MRKPKTVPGRRAQLYAGHPRLFLPLASKEARMTMITFAIAHQAFRKKG
jgi:hypothetical protein